MDKNYWKNFKIGVFMGGPSPEHEISLKSGDAVYRALKEERLNVIPVKLPKDLDIRGNGVDKTLEEVLDDTKINLVFNSLHGSFGEDGQLQKILDRLDVPYTGSKAKPSCLAMDKVSSREIFVKAGIPVPRYRVLTERNLSGMNFSLPVVVKPARGGSSIGVSIAEHKDDLEKAINLAFSYDKKIIIEDYIVGEEITVAILDNNPLPVIQIVPRQRFYNYQAKYEDHGTKYLLPAPIAKDLQIKVQVQAVKAHRALGCSSFSRVDMILGRKKNPVVLEINTIPGLTVRSLLPKAARAKKISFNQLCLKMLDSAFS